MKKIKIYLNGKKNQRVKTINYFVKNKRLLKLGIILSYRKINYFDYNNIQKLVKIGNLASLSSINILLQNINLF